MYLTDVYVDGKKIRNLHMTYDTYENCIIFEADYCPVKLNACIKTNGLDFKVDEFCQYLTTNEESLHNVMVASVITNRYHVNSDIWLIVPSPLDIEFRQILHVICDTAHTDSYISVDSICDVGVMLDKKYFSLISFVDKYYNKEKDLLIINESTSWKFWKIKIRDRQAYEYLTAKNKILKGNTYEYF